MNCDVRRRTTPFAAAATRRDETAAILFTSGSTGPPKGVVYTHGIFAAQVEALREIYDIEPGEIDLPTFPLFALFAPALGMTAVIPEMDFTRPGIGRSRGASSSRPADFGATTMFGSPALLNRVGRYGGEARRHAARAEAGHLGRRAGAGRGPGALCHAARPRRPDLHPLRRHRGAAGLLHRQPRDPGRDRQR